MRPKAEEPEKRPKDSGEKLQSSKENRESSGSRAKTPEGGSRRLTALGQMPGVPAKKAQVSSKDLRKQQIEGKLKLMSDEGQRSFDKAGNLSKDIKFEGEGSNGESEKKDTDSLKN